MEKRKVESWSTVLPCVVRVSGLCFYRSCKNGKKLVMLISATESDMFMPSTLNFKAVFLYVMPQPLTLNINILSIRSLLDKNWMVGLQVCVQHVFLSWFREKSKEYDENFFLMGSEKVVFVTE